MRACPETGGPARYKSPGQALAGAPHISYERPQGRWIGYG
jgi:hypothetical protein